MRITPWRTAGSALLTLAVAAAGLLAAPSAAQAVNTGWSGLGSPAPGEYIEQLKVGHNADGGLEVFASTHPFNGAPHRLFHIGQREDGGWGSWQYLGENADGHFAIASEADFRLRVFLNGTPVVRTIAQVTPSGAWGPWEDTAMPTAKWGSLAADKDPWGRVHLFAVGEGVVSRLVETQPNGAWQGLAPVVDVDDPISSVLRLSRNADGRLELFLFYPTNVRHLWQTASGAWTAPYPLAEPSEWLTDLTVMHQPDGRIDVMGPANMANSKPIAISQAGPNGGWYINWRPLTVPAWNNSNSVFSTQNADGTPELYFFQGGAWNRTVQRVPGQDVWDTPALLRGATGPLAAGLDTANRQWLFSSSTDRLVYRRQHFPGRW